ncbi:aminotransferase class III-fold pyridoxal phosphate-dependent enzyme [Vibrio sp.]|uniref:aminotransferase class III-fold pyridoxal phosphate-dependent enzyme n=1 Tax=Vibrio sp. TaxID=678 RepID=UPI00311DEEA1
MNADHQLTHKASGGTVTLADGSKIFDLATGGIGHSTKYVVNKIKAQSMKMGLSNRVLISEPLLEFCRSLSQKLPDQLSNVYVCSSGDEAFEGALKMCKALKPSAKTIAYVSDCVYGTLVFGRCMDQGDKFDKVKSFFDIDFLEVDRDKLATSPQLSGEVFALCYSPVYRDKQGEIRLLDSQQLKNLKAMSLRFDVPLVCCTNEFCMGVIGNLFGCDFSSVIPDVLVLGGAMGGNLIPVGCYISSEANAKDVYGSASPAKHGSTTGGNPLACVAGLSTLEFVEDMKADVQFCNLGETIAQALKPYSVSVVGSIVNLALPNHIDANTIKEKLREVGVLVRPPHGRVLSLYPMLGSHNNDLTNALSAIKGVLDDSEKF